MCKVLFNTDQLKEAKFPAYEVGKEHIINLDLVNDYHSTVQYEIESTNPELEIIKYTERLDASSRGNIIVKFKPNKTRRESFLGDITIKEVFL